MKEKKPKCPVGISKEAQKLWHSTLNDYVVESDAGLKLLEAACRAWDRLRDAQRMIARDGSTFHDRFGQPRNHPALEVELKCSAEFRALLKQLGVDEEDEPPRGPGRPPGSGMGLR